MPFEFCEQRLSGVVLVKPRVYRDERGHFLETYSRAAFREAGLPETFVQMNHSRSTRGVLRGLHFQKEPKAQGKLIRAVSGEIYDVVVDLRPESGTRGEWLAVHLSGENQFELYVPPGFAHGFCVLSDIAEVSYSVTEEYSPEHEDGVLWNDPGLGIEWPVSDPIVAPRDMRWPLYSAAARATQRA